MGFDKDTAQRAERIINVAVHFKGERYVADSSIVAEDRTYRSNEDGSNFHEFVDCKSLLDNRTCI